MTIKKDVVTLAHGSGGEEMDALISSFGFDNRGRWDGCDDDAATFPLPFGQRLAFTSDSFTVNPLFFPGGNIGHLAFAGTVNDLCVMGARPLGLSLSLVIEEGFSLTDLDAIIGTLKDLSAEYDIPIVTGDTKVMEKGKIDKLIINTSAVGLVDKSVLLNKPLVNGDKIILSGALGEHAVALLSKRFDYESPVVSDTKPLLKELKAIARYIKVAKDPTRGGLAAVLNDIAKKNHVGMLLDEQAVPIKPAVAKVVEMLGIDVYELACEGRVVCFVSPVNANKVVDLLKGFNHDAAIIGEVNDSSNVKIKTFLGSRIMPVPTGRIVPRIC